jgi:hypothetical protein
MLKEATPFRRPVAVGLATLTAMIVAACGSGGGGSPTSTSTTTNTPAPTASATASGSTSGTLTVTGQVSDTATLQSPVACNSPQGLSLQGGASNIYQLLLMDLVPGPTELAGASTQVTVELTLVSGAGTRYVWQGGGGMGSGTVTAPASASAQNSAAGMYSIDAALVPTSGNGATESEHVSGSWPCF